MNSEIFLSKGKRVEKNKLGAFLREKFNSSTKVKIVMAYLSEAGFSTLIGGEKDNKKNFLEKLEYIILGQLSFKAYEVYRDIYNDFPNHRNKLFVNYGLGKENLKRITYWAPMIHSKIFALDYHNSSNLFYIGSANVTDYALNDINGEAGVILPELDEKTRNNISNYMDSFLPKNLPSTHLFDPEEASSLIYLYTLRDREEENYLNKFAKTSSVSIIFCYNPTKQRFSIGDTFYTEFNKNSNKMITKIHGSLNSQIERYTIFYLFDSLESLIKMDLDSAVVYPTINVALTRETAKMKIEGILTYFERIPPFIFPKNSIVTTNNLGKESFQPKCKVIDISELDEEIQGYCQLDKNKELTRNIITTDRLRSDHEYKLKSMGNSNKDTKKYSEILSFKYIRKYKKLTEKLSERISTEVEPFFEHLEHRLNSEK